MEGAQPLEERQCQTGDLSRMIRFSLMPIEEDLDFVRQ